MEIIFDACPSCKTQACAFAVIDGKTVCPMCAPVPDKTPHDYRPSLAKGGVVDLGGRVVVVGETGPEQYARCCGDPGDCGKPCAVLSD